MRALVGLVVAALLIAGCATQTPYKPAEKKGDQGYTETKLTNNRYRITFIGNSSTPKDTVKDYALLRAGELTLQEGYDWFQIASADNDKKQRSGGYVGGGVDVPAQTTVYQRCGMLRCSTAAVVTNPGFDSEVGGGVGPTTTEYSSSIEIVIGKFPMPNNVESYDAKQLVRTLRQNLPKN